MLAAAPYVYILCHCCLFMLNLPLDAFVMNKEMAVPEYRNLE